jgi:xanthine dehydrogenase YagS FAD-binding subunit
MRPFSYERAADLAQAALLGRETGQGQTDAVAQFLFGGTTLVDLMKLDVLRPKRLVDLVELKGAHGGIAVSVDGLHLGAMASMAEVAAHPDVRRDYPAVAQSLELAASPQIRNMASLGGNVLQRTRCPYFRDPSWTACNKRNPGSGCAAIEGFNRNHAVLGVDQSCVSQYPGDLAVVLSAFDTELEIVGAAGARRMPFSALHRPADGKPHLENNLQSGDIIIGFKVPAGAWTRRSLYLKVRDRASYEFALASAAVGLDLEDGVVRQVRVGLGGVAYRPWRSPEAEGSLIGKPLNEAAAQAAAEAAFAGAVTHGGNDFKPELGRRTLVRALLEARDRTVNAGGA